VIPDRAKRITTDPIYAAKRVSQEHEKARYWDRIANDPDISKVRRDEAAIKRDRAKELAIEFDRWVPGPPTGEK
jgi:hypothetical protein